MKPGQCGRPRHMWSTHVGPARKNHSRLSGFPVATGMTRNDPGPRKGHTIQDHSYYNYSLIQLWKINVNQTPKQTFCTQLITSGSGLEAGSRTRGHARWCGSALCLRSVEKRGAERTATMYSCRSQSSHRIQLFTRGQGDPGLVLRVFGLEWYLILNGI